MGESGNIMASYRYDAFGNVIEHTGIDSNITYAGYQYDKETDLYYLNARYYDSKIARFMTEDTYTGEANDPLSLNLYTYCYNNPIIYIDPTGHYVSDWDRYNLSRDAITQLENCGAAWNIARANNDKEGMAIAHQSAEIIRNSTGLRDGTNVKGNANGNTMVVNSSGQLSVYVSQNSSTQRQQEINETRSNELAIVSIYKSTNNWNAPLNFNMFMNAMVSQPVYTENGIDIGSSTNILLCTSSGNTYISKVAKAEAKRLLDDVLKVYYRWEWPEGYKIDDYTFGTYYENEYEDTLQWAANQLSFLGFLTFVPDLMYSISSAKEEAGGDVPLQVLIGIKNIIDPNGTPGLKDLPSTFLIQGYYNNKISEAKEKADWINNSNYKYLVYYNGFLFGSSARKKFIGKIDELKTSISNTKYTIFKNKGENEEYKRELLKYLEEIKNMNVNYKKSFEKMNSLLDAIEKKY